MTARRISRLLMASLLVSACGGGGASSRAVTASGQPPVPSTPSFGSRQPSPTLPPSAGPTSPGTWGAAPGATLERPWATAQLTDVTTGDSFRIAELAAAGKVVFIETMAIWCTNCRAQQRAATTAFKELDPDRVAWVAVDVEASENAEALARYRDLNKFPFVYAIADAGLARALVDDFGETILSPPVVNLIVIGTDGRITQLHGHKSAEELRRLAADHGV